MRVDVARASLALASIMLTAVLATGCATSLRKKFDAKLQRGDFAFVLGQGSGLRGFDVLRVTSTGECWFTFGPRDHRGRRVVRSARFELSPGELAALKAKLTEIRIFTFKERYHDYGAVGGDRWFIKVREGQERKVIYLENTFPIPLAILVNFIHRSYLEPRRALLKDAERIEYDRARENEREPLP
jgi:hypothetical protein